MPKKFKPEKINDLNWSNNGVRNQNRNRVANAWGNKDETEDSAVAIVIGSVSTPLAIVLDSENLTALADQCEAANSLDTALAAALAVDRFVAPIYAACAYAAGVGVYPAEIEAADKAIDCVHGFVDAVTRDAADPDTALIAMCDVFEAAAPPD